MRIVGYVMALVFGITIAHADQLPAPSSWQDRRCEIIFQGLQNVLYQNRDYFYDVRGVRDRDELAKQMTEFSSTLVIINNFNQLCPIDARDFPKAAILQLSYKIIADRFGDPP